MLETKRSKGVKKNFNKFPVSSLYFTSSFWRSFLQKETLHVCNEKRRRRRRRRRRNDLSNARWTCAFQRGTKGEKWNTKMQQVGKKKQQSLHQIIRRWWVFVLSEKKKKKIYIYIYIYVCIKETTGETIKSNRRASTFSNATKERKGVEPHTCPSKKFVRVVIISYPSRASIIRVYTNRSKWNRSIRHCSPTMSD